MLDTILIIDDDLSHRAALAECFEAAGYDVVTAEDGVQGAQCITTLRPGIVVMEALLPRRDGFELCNWLKSDPRFKHMPVILITSIHLTAEQKRQGIAVGRKQFVFRADRVLSKPVRPEEVLAEVGKLLGRPVEEPPAQELENVLVIDNDRETLELVKGWLGRDDYPVATAQTAREGIEMSMAESPDLVLLAATLREQSATSMVKQLRLLMGEEVAIVIMAKVGEGDLVAEAMKAGADNFIRKPIDFAQLTQLLLHDLEEYHIRTVKRQLIKQLKSTSSDLMRKVDELRSERRRANQVQRYIQAILDGLGDQLEIVRPEHISQYTDGVGGLPACCSDMGGGKPCSDCPVLKAYHTGQRAFTEVTAMGGRSVLCSATPVIDPKGRRVVVRMMKDVTERRMAEGELYRHSKMTTLSSIAAYTAGHLDGFLGAARDCAQAALHGRNDTDPLGALQRILDLLEEPSRLVDNMNRFAERTAPNGRTIDLQAHLNSILTAVERNYGKHGSIERAISPVTVSADPAQLEQVFVNLLTNAFDYAGEQPRVAVHLKTESGRDGNWAVVTVADNGPGIPLEDREQIFEQFFTSKPSGRTSPGAWSHRSGEDTGSGLGLTIVRQVVERHGGSICVEDSPLGGAAFVVRLPVSVPSVPAVPKQAPLGVKS